MLDTTVFNHVLCDRVGPRVLATRGTLFATHVQYQELQTTKNLQKRDQLEEVFKVIGPNRITTATSLFEVAPWDAGEWASEDGLFDVMLAELNRLDGAKDNNSVDILIAETAIRGVLTLVTDDTHLGQAVRTFNGESLRLAQLLSPGNAPHVPPSQ
jgi:hypothetical protein